MLNALSLHFIKVEYMKYSFLKGIVKSAVAVLLVGLPVVVQVLPAEWMNLTVGGLLVLLVNFLKVKYR